MSKSTKFLLAPPKIRSVVPARSTVTVNKSVLGLSARKSKTNAKRAEDAGKVDEVFNENVEIAIALLPTVTFRRKFQNHLIRTAYNLNNLFFISQTQQLFENGFRLCWIHLYRNRKEILICHSWCFKCRTWKSPTRSTRILQPTLLMWIKFLPWDLWLHKVIKRFKRTFLSRHREQKWMPWWMRWRTKTWKIFCVKASHLTVLQIFERILNPLQNSSTIKSHLLMVYLPMVDVSVIISSKFSQFLQDLNKSCLKM